MNVTIHRGRHEIGGSCVEVASGGTRIVLDVGMPLVNTDHTEFNFSDYEGLTGPQLLEKSVLPRVEGLYHWETPTVDAVLVSHAHQDHYGFLNHVHPEIPVYLSDATQILVEITASFTGKVRPHLNFKHFVWPSSFTIGSFTVTPHLVDHSSFSSFAIEVQADGKRLFYSGDFRGHGYLSKAMDILYEQVKPGVDALLMEGTMLGRQAEKVVTEEELSQEATEVCRNSEKAVLIYQSGQNISRAVSFFKAARRTGRYFVPDIYTAHVMYELGHCSGGSKLPFPGKSGFENVRVWYPKSLTDRIFKSGREQIAYKFQPYKMIKEEMGQNLHKLMLFVRPGMERDLKHIQGLSGSILIYSLWDGYREKERTRRFLDAVEKLGVTVRTLHTSGHADLSCLKDMVQKLQPKRLIPIHTFHPHLYEETFGVPVEVSHNGQYSL